MIFIDSKNLRRTVHRAQCVVHAVIHTEASVRFNRRMHRIFVMLRYGYVSHAMIFRRGNLCVWVRACVRALCSLALCNVMFTVYRGNISFPFLPFLLDDSAAAAADKVTVAIAYCVPAASLNLVRRTTVLRARLGKSNALWVMVMSVLSLSLCVYVPRIKMCLCIHQKMFSDALHMIFQPCTHIQKRSVFFLISIV